MTQLVATFKTTIDTNQVLNLKETKPARYTKIANAKV